MTKEHHRKRYSYFIPEPQCIKENIFLFHMKSENIYNKMIYNMYVFHAHLRPPAPFKKKKFFFFYFFRHRSHSLSLSPFHDLHSPSCHLLLPVASISNQQHCYYIILTMTYYLKSYRNKLFSNIFVDDIQNMSSNP